MATEQNKTILFIGEKKRVRLKKSFPEYLKSNRKRIINYFGEKTGEIIFSEAKHVYPGIVNKTPCFNTPMYDALIILAGKMAALKKGMKSAGIGTEEFVKFFVENTRSTARKIPSFLRNLGGKVYLSKLVRIYLKSVAESVTANGWPTKLIDGSKENDFDMSVETKDCQMIAFWESIGEGDIKPYCTFFDFTSAELLGIGLKQVSKIDSGICKYCFYKRGGVQWPEAVQKILT
jgi:hypothetical protein